VKKKDWQGKTDGGYFGQRCLFLFFMHGSITFGYALVSVAIFFYLIFRFKAAKNIYDYFRDHQHYGAFKSYISVYRNHYLFGKTLIDKFAMFSGRRDEYTIQVDGQNLYNDMLNDANKGGILLSSHVGSTEIAGYLLTQTIKPLNAVVFGGESSEMQKHRSELLEQHNVHMIPVTDGFSHIFAINEALQKSELISIAADRIYKGSRNLMASFMGAPAAFPIAPFTLAVKLKIPILALFVMQEGYMKYHCYLVRIEIENPEKHSPQEQMRLLMNEYVSELEKILTKYPLQWYNFHPFWA